MIPKEERQPWDELRALLERDDMTQRQLARETGYSPQYINDIIQGRVLPSYKVCRKFSEVLRYPVENILPDSVKNDERMRMVNEFRDLPDLEQRTPVSN